MRTGDMPNRTLPPEASDIVHDVTNEEGPPDDECKEQSQGSAYMIAATINRLTPTRPVCGEHTQAYGGEILLEIKETQRMPMVIAFQTWLNVDLKIQVDDRAEQPGGQIQNDDSIGETRTSHRAKPAEERIRLGRG
jgi:hypothetical protein